MPEQLRSISFDLDQLATEIQVAIALLDGAISRNATTLDDVALVACEQ